MLTHRAAGIRCNMKLQDIINKNDIRQEEHDNYCYFVPKFIESAKACESWQDWDQDLFYEFFERGGHQCVSSLKQGYFTNEEKAKIKDNWNELAPMLKAIAESQDSPKWDVYEEIKVFIKQRTNQDRRAATNRLIASLQPNLLCTIVKESCLVETFNLMRNVGIEDVPEIDSNSWFKRSYSLLTFFKSKLKCNSVYDICTYSWQVRDYLKNSSEKQTCNMENIQSYIKLLKANKNLVLTGAPGTGKTFLAKEIAKAMDAEVEFVQFHPSYDYTDFVEGLRPIKKGDILGFERIDGVFKEFCKKAIGLPSEHSYSGGAYVFIIDEINRGDLSKIFGELFYAIDPGYRGEKGKVKTQYQNLINKDDVFADGLFVPENVYILATMNDIDRSVESMDFALRRRFAWKEIKPEDRSEMLSEKLDHDTCEKAARVMTNLNKAITKTRGLGSAYQIGPAYFLKLDKERYNGDFTALWDMHIEILLKEYLRGYSNADAKVEDLKKIYFDSLNGTTIDDADQ